MLKFTAGYANTQNNFVIGNLDRFELLKDDPDYPVFCVVRNILTRGRRIRLSEHLRNTLSFHQDLAENDRYLPLVSSAVPEWHSIIQGDPESGDNPAMQFYYDLIPKWLGEAKVIQQLMIPENPLIDIVPDDHELACQRVDFYLPQAHLIIEVDGSQHDEDVHSIRDQQRDDAAQKRNIQTVRIPARAIRENSLELNAAIKKIYHQIQKYWKTDDPNSAERSIQNHARMFGSPYTDPQMRLQLLKTAIMRWQILLLACLMRGVISLNEPKITFCVQCNDFSDVDFIKDALRLAADDLSIWIGKVKSLLRKEHRFPDIDIIEPDSENTTTCRILAVDFSLLQRWDERLEADLDVITVRSDYDDDISHYQIACAPLICYDLNVDESTTENDIASLEFFIRNLFNDEQIRNFRDGQLPIIASALSRRDTIGILPTGAGKSLCYQLCTLLQPGVTIIVDPIKSLMVDQHRSVSEKLQVDRAAYINSSQGPEERARIQRQFNQGQFQFLWITPERLLIPAYRSSLSELFRQFTLAYAVIDEVHCMSEWGHDFRTSYLTLVRSIRSYLFNPCLIGLTATASTFVYKDLLSEFDIQSDQVKTPISFSREELNFSVRTVLPNESSEQLLINFLEDKKSTGIFNQEGEKYLQGGLVFTQIKKNSRFRKGCRHLAPLLAQKLNMPVESFASADRDSAGHGDERQNYETQQRFLADQLGLVVATKAFGMGIDKPNIRFVVHDGIPGSLDSLYQEAGRAGRDRRTAECIILYTRDNLTPEERAVLFGLNSTISEIRKVRARVSEKSDLNTILFFLLDNNRGTDFDLRMMQLVYRKHIMIDEPLISARDYHDQICCLAIAQEEEIHPLDEYGKTRIRDYLSSFSILQKAVYRLSILGLVHDWLVEAWGDKSGIIRISKEGCSDNLEQVSESFTTYVRRYEPDFVAEKYIESLDLETLPDVNPIEQYFHGLLRWTEENIVYSRRQGIKNIIELCDNYSDPVSFRRRIEAYFRIAEVQPKLNYIADNSSTSSYWIEPFYGTDHAYSQTISPPEKLVEISTALQRMLEDYRYHTGLNFVSGLNRFLLDDFAHPDGRERLASAFDRIRGFNRVQQIQILNDLLATIRAHQERNGSISRKACEEMGELLCGNYQNISEQTQIYKCLRDQASLYQILRHHTGNIQEIIQMV